ncbi:MAG: GntR family transcriptional regulator [Solirubrobacterales bacterium]
MKAIEASTDEPLPADLSLERPRGDEPLVDVVYTELRDAICDGRLSANQKLPQIPLAKHLGISRTPVRDALQRLAQEGLVRAVSFRGFVVSEFSAREVLDVYQVRLALEPLAIMEAFPNYSRMDIAAMWDICDRAAATDLGEVRALYDLNSDFHMKLAEPCPNEVLVRMLRQLWQLPSSLRLFHAQAHRTSAMKASDGEHRAVLEAIEAGDRDLAVARITEHIRTAEDDTLKAFGEGDLATASG